MLATVRTDGGRYGIDTLQICTRVICSRRVLRPMPSNGPVDKRWDEVEAELADVGQWA